MNGVSIIILNLILEYCNVMVGITYVAMWAMNHNTMDARTVNQNGECFLPGAIVKMIGPRKYNTEVYLCQYEASA